MENASKAILLSGAVLIAVILISLGVYVISSQKGTIDQSKKSADAVTTSTYNSTFLKYLGKRKGSEIKQLKIDVNTSNAKHKDDGREEVELIELSGCDLNDIKPYHTYTVSEGDDTYDDEGYVKKLYVSY